MGYWFSGHLADRWTLKGTMNWNKPNVFKGRTAATGISKTAGVHSLFATGPLASDRVLPPEHAAILRGCEVARAPALRACPAALKMDGFGF